MKQRILKAQEGSQLLALNTTVDRPETTPITPITPTPAIKPALAKRTVTDYLKDYSEYTRLKNDVSIMRSPESMYRDRVQASMKNWDGRQVQASLSKNQEDNRWKIIGENRLDPTKSAMNYCQLGACKVLNDAGDTFTGKDSVDGAYFGTYTAEDGLLNDGFAIAKDPHQLKLGDMLHIRERGEDGAPQLHASLYAGNVLDEKGNVVGMKGFHNNGDGKEGYVYYVDDDKYVPKGGVRSTASYSDLMSDYNTDKPATDTDLSFRAYTKQFPKEDAEAVRQRVTERDTKAQALRDSLLKWGAFKDDNEMAQFFKQRNAELGKPQQVKIYDRPYLRKRGGVTQWLK